MRRVDEPLVAAALEEPVFPPSTLDNSHVVRGDSVPAAPFLLGSHGAAPAAR